MFLADAVVETHDRIVGRTYRTAVRAKRNSETKRPDRGQDVSHRRARTCEAQLGDETAAVREALRSFAALGNALIGARDAGAALDAGLRIDPASTAARSADRREASRTGSTGRGEGGAASG